MRTILLVVSLFLTGSGLFAQDFDAPVRIGAVLPLTGPAAGIGAIHRAGLELGVRELNRSEDPTQPSFELLVEDTGSEPKNAVTAFRKLTELQKVKIIFTISSSAAMAIKPLAEAGRILLFADVTHPELTKNSQYILRHSSTADKDAAVLAQAVIGQGIQDFAIVYQNDEWGVAYESALRSILGQNGVRVRSEPRNSPEIDLNGLFTRMRLNERGGLGVVLFGPGAGEAVRRARQLGFSGPIFSSVGFVFTREAQLVAGEAARGMWYQTFLPNQAFAAAYREEFNREPPLLGQLAFTDLEILASAIRTTSTTDPRVLAPFIRSRGTFQGRFERVKIQPNGDIQVPSVMMRWGF